MTLITICISCVIALLPLNIAVGTVLHVPADYPTIQAALDSTNRWDTVSVAPGTYHELLQSPLHSFVLMGWHRADTTAEARTTFDPNVFGVDTPSVFRVFGDTAVVKNIAFYNRPAIRQYEIPTRSGAIQSAARLLIVEQCRFDSVSSPLWRGSRIEIQNCRFVGCFGSCVLTSLSGRLKAENCYFESEGYSVVTCYGGSEIDSCVFANNPQGGYLLNIRGPGAIVSNCRFGPYVGAFSVVDIYPNGDVLIENCVFEGIDQAYSLIQAGFDHPISMDYPLVIRGNTFRDYHTFGPSSGTIAINLQCSQCSFGRLAIIEGNTFIDGDGATVLTPGVQALSATVLLRDNEFENLDPATLPDFRAEGPSQDTIRSHNNSFLPPGLAASTVGSYFDARENWWGDSTGPYNASVNPEGQGSEVGNGVLFVPWLTQHPDSIDSTEVAIETPSVQLPSAYSLAAFPNPFNATTILSVEVARAGNYDIVLYDVTGREVTTLYSGRIESSQNVQVNAERIASGVYFAELRSMDNVFTATKLLLLK